MSSEHENAGRSPADQLRALGPAVARVPVEDSPRWHLSAAEEAMDEGRWDVARAAIQRSAEGVGLGSVDRDEIAFSSLRLAVSTVDLRLAAAVIAELTQRLHPEDDGWNRRARRIIEAAPQTFVPSMRERLVGALPQLSGALTADPAWTALEHEALVVGDPACALPNLPGDEWAPDQAVDPEASDRQDSDLPPVPVESPFAAVRRQRASAPESAAGDDVVLFDDLHSWPEQPRGFAGHITVPADEVDLTDGNVLRDRLVEEMLASVTDEEGQLLFATATTFLNNREFETAEIMFSALMQLSDFRVAGCEGVVQALVGAERFAEAVSQAARAARIFAREGDALLGILYWQGVAAQAQGDVDGARACFTRVLVTPHHPHFPDLAARMAALG